MKCITIRSQILEVVERWTRQYSTLGDPDKIAIGTQLSKLDLNTATTDMLAAIIGNDSWACPTRCDECGQIVNTVVELGEEPDYESATARICRPCLQKAVALAEKEEE